MNSHTISPKSVFIVEDSAPIRQRLVRLLGDIDGVTIVGQADTPEGAIYGIHESHPDMVVLDYQLIGGTGVDVMRGVQDMMSRMTVIMLTNHPNPQYRKVCLKAGAQYFFDKSAEFDCVKDVIAASVNATGMEH